MRKRYYSIYDTVAEDFSPLFEARNDGVATRQFVDSLRKMPVLLKSDYILYHVGTLNVEVASGCISCDFNTELIYIIKGDDALPEEV